MDWLRDGIVGGLALCVLLWAARVVWALATDDDAGGESDVS